MLYEKETAIGVLVFALRSHYDGAGKKGRKHFVAASPTACPIGFMCAAGEPMQ